jgi:hypothetical protein
MYLSLDYSSCGRLVCSTELMLLTTSLSLSYPMYFLFIYTVSLVSFNTVNSLQSLLLLSSNSLLCCTVSTGSSGLLLSSCCSLSHEYETDTKVQDITAFSCQENWSNYIILNRTWRLTTVFKNESQKIYPYPFQQVSVLCNIHFRSSPFLFSFLNWSLSLKFSNQSVCAYIFSMIMHEVLSIPFRFSILTHSPVKQWCTEAPPPKIWSFEKAELYSQFCGKYVRNNLIRIRVLLVSKLSGNPD